MRLLLRSATNSRPCESNASTCGPFSSPSPEPRWPKFLMNLPFLSNFTMREFPNVGACPSEMKMSPFGAKAIPVGRSNTLLSLPPCPALPSVISTLPSGDSLNTWLPLPSRASPSIAQMLPWGSGFTVWGKANMPPPKFFSTLPSDESSQIGAVSEPRQPFAVQRSITQTSSLASTNTLLVGAHGREVCAQSLTRWYGLGASLTQGADVCACAAAVHAPVASRATAN